MGEFKGVWLIQHGGNTLGFTSLLAFLPDKRLGVVLSNAQSANAFTMAVVNRVLELAFDQSQEYEAKFRFALEAQAKAQQETLAAFSCSRTYTAFATPTWENSPSRYGTDASL